VRYSTGATGMKQTSPSHTIADGSPAIIANGAGAGASVAGVV